MRIKLTTVLLLCLMSGCTHAPMPLMVKYLDSWHRGTRFTPTHDVIAGPDGFPIFGACSNQVTSKWQIHPAAPLAMVARSTTDFQDMERIELWTSTGVFILGAPCYGGRRIPWLDKTDIEYRVSHDFHVSRNHVAWLTGRNGRDVAHRIFADLKRKENLGFVNLYFEFTSTNTWHDAEGIVNAVLPQLDGLRGFWLGFDTTNAVTMHFHDVWRDEWKTVPPPPVASAGAGRQKPCTIGAKTEP